MAQAPWDAGDSDGHLSPKGRRTKRQLMTAARTIFETDGFHAARIEDISRAAGVSHGTFYTYFDSKGEIFRELMMELAKATVATHRSAGDDPIAGVFDGIKVYVHSYRDSAALMLQFELMAMVDEEVFRLLEASRSVAIDRATRSIRLLQGKKYARADLDIDYVARALVAMTGRTCYEWFAFGGDLDLDRVVLTLTRAWLAVAGMSDERIAEELKRIGVDPI